MGRVDNVGAGILSSISIMCRHVECLKAGLFALMIVLLTLTNVSKIWTGCARFVWGLWGDLDPGYLPIWLPISGDVSALFVLFVLIFFFPKVSFFFLYFFLYFFTFYFLWTGVNESNDAMVRHLHTLILYSMFAQANPC